MSVMASLTPTIIPKTVGGEIEPQTECRKAEVIPKAGDCSQGTFSGSPSISSDQSNSRPVDRWQVKRGR